MIWDQVLVVFKKLLAPHEPVMTTDKLIAAGVAATAEAERLWNLDVIDPPIGSKDPRAPLSLKTINEIISFNGWDTNTSYKGDGPPQWCGMLAGACWGKAGLDPSWLPTYFASTYRLGLWANYKRFSPSSKPNPSPATGQSKRLIGRLDRGKAPPFEPSPGDIIIVGDGEPAEGDHITVNMKYDGANSTFDTISGNGGGLGPHGDKRQGISRRDYSINAVTGYRAMWIIRPAVEDLR